MKFLAYIVLIFACLTVGFAQSHNVNLVANLNNYPAFGYTDCWGYTAPDGSEYALLGVNGGVSIVNVTDPNNISEVDFVLFVNHSWYDMKTYQSYMYVSSEGSLSVLIVDLSTLPDSASVVGSVTGLTSTPHNIFIDTEMGILYVVEDFRFNPAVRIFSLSDPVNPVQLSTIGTANIGTDSHDIFAQDSVLYVAEGINPTIGIFDVRDPANPSLLNRLTIPAAGYVHQVWVTEDNSYMVTTEETTGKTVKVWDIRDINNISLVSEYLGESRLAHNAYFKGDFIYISHYESGLKVLDFSDPSNVVEVGFYDTYPQTDSPNFNGAWGVYPFAQNGMIFVSDIQTGLYVLEFDSVRAGGIEGTVTDFQTGAPLPDVNVFFAEANKTVLTNSSGFYSLRTFEGNHTVTFSKPGYVSETLLVNLPAGPNIVQNISLDSNLVVIEVTADTLGMVLPIDTITTAEIIISNVGPSGRLNYMIDDINGPLPPVNQSVQHRRIDWGSLKFDFSQSQMGKPAHTDYSPRLNSGLGDTIIIDPVGDIDFGMGPDIISVFATVTTSNVTFDFEFLNSLNTDSAFAVLSLDTDFDPTTGAFPGGFGFNLPGQNMGSEYDVLLDISGNIMGTPLTTFVFHGSNSAGGGSLVFMGGMSMNANTITTTIPLSAIGNDDGNMAVAGFAGHISSTSITSIDYMPNAGNGTVGVNALGDLPWLSLSPTSGSVLAGESDTVIVTFDTHGLQQSGVFAGLVVIYSNDLNQPVVSKLVTLLTEPVVMASISGTIRDSVSGQGVVADLLFFREGDPTGKPNYATTSQPDGSFSVLAIIGRYRIEVSAGPPYTDSIDPKNVNLPAGGAVVDFPLLQAQILLVDDDAGDSYEGRYQASLDRLNISRRTLSVADSGTTPGGALASFTQKPVLLWFTGNDSTDALTADERLVIINHLAAGGDAIITGQNIAEFSNPGDSLIEGYLGIQQNGNFTGALVVKGFPGDIIGDGILYQLVGGAGNQTSKDILSIVGGSVGTPTKTLYYGAAAADTANIAAVRVLGPGAFWGVSYFGFGLEVFTEARMDTLILRSMRYFDVVVSVPEPSAGTVPNEFSLSQNYPNPFNPSTTIEYSLPEESFVTIKVHNILGQEIAALVSEVKEPGTYRTSWDASAVASGVYFYQMKAGEFVGTKKLLLLK